MNLDKFIGDEKAFPLEHRILNTVLLIGIAITIITTVTDYANGLIISSAASAVCFFILGALYYLSIAKKSYRVTIVAAVSLVFASVPVLWLADGGILGATSLFILIFAAMITVSIKGTARIALLVGGLLAEALGLMAVQYFFPHLIYYYATRESQFVDNFVGLVIGLIVITSLYVIILNYYRREHDRATEYRVRLEKQEMELEMARLDRLNLIGEMAASIGHEVRNPLTTIRGYLQMFLNKQEYGQHREHFDMMIGELDRANAIITEFLGLAKNKAVRLEPCDIGEVLERIVPLVRAGALEAGKEVALRLAKVPRIEADAGEIRQLVLNLVSNALDAIGPGGRVTIGTRRDKDRVVLSVSDTGPGIPPEIYAKLGTPFLTGKEKGTGLGIPICYRIAERHDARIEIDTGAQGTTFRVMFPISAAGTTTGKR